jgi:hypothetical protein
VRDVGHKRKCLVDVLSGNKRSRTGDAG